MVRNSAPTFGDEADILGRFRKGHLEAHPSLPAHHGKRQDDDTASFHDISPGYAPLASTISVMGSDREFGIAAMQQLMLMDQNDNEKRLYLASTLHWMKSQDDCFAWNGNHGEFR